ncbi:MAG: hypothetical protein ABSF29_08785 [Tepidisphaeraceae bacterium]|jgi:hypothetical protein
MQSASQVLRAILDRYDNFKGRFSVPVEGGERGFRAWLVIDLFHHHFRWPSGLILVGERHDVLLLNESLFPVITIETKEPRHEASKKEIRSFETRLPHYTTLKYAYLTDGFKWIKLYLAAPAGHQTIAKKEIFDVCQHDDTAINKFLATFDATQYISKPNE